MKKQAKLSPTSYAMLGLLARTPQSAYELNSSMQTSLMRAFWPRAESHVYSEPKKLLEKQLVTALPETQNGRKRTVYTITDKGREALGEWLASATDPYLRLQAEFVLKLILAGYSPVENARQTLQQARAASDTDLRSAIEGIKQILDTPQGASDGMPYNGICINLMADLLIARYEWGHYAASALEGMEDGIGAEESQARGTAAYRQALEKLQQAINKGNLDGVTGPN